MPWNLPQKIVFRFFATYVFLYTMSTQFILSGIFDMLWQKVVPWFAENILQLSEKITVFSNGSGDTTYNYVSLLVFALIAAVVTLVWTLLNPKQLKEEKLMDGFLVLVRYYIIFNMVLYGLAKLFYIQFQEPYFSRLIQPYGDSSPMGLLWTFMGFSMGYTIFTGVAEFLGGILLLFRKTRTLGALVVFGVMANVMALNYFYDVPVKLLSTHLVALSLFLLILDGQRVLDFFVKNKAVAPRVITPLFANPKYERWKNIAKWVVVVGGLGAGIFMLINLKIEYGPDVNRPKLYGLYEVESFERNGAEVPPLLTDSTRWRDLIVQRKGAAQVRMTNDKMSYYSFEPDSLGTYALFHLTSDTTHVDTLHYTLPDSAHLQLTGIYLGDTLAIDLRKKEKDEFRLMNRGFHWISEYPFNR